MAIVSVSFRITRDSAEDYDKRYKAITDKIKSFATTLNRWDGTTSYYVMETSSTAAKVAHDVYMLPEFRRDKEEILVINLSERKDHGRHGKIGDLATLDKLLDKR